MEELRNHIGNRAGEIRVRHLIAMLVFTAFGVVSMLPEAEAAPLEAVGARDHLVSDGARFVSYIRTDETPMIFDTRSGNVREIRGADGCKPGDVGFGYVLLDCADGFYTGSRLARIASIKTGRSHQIPGAGKYDDFDFGEIGRHWVRAECATGGPCYTVHYVNYRRGKRRIFDTTGPFPNIPDGLSRYDYDLNYKRLGRLKPHPDFSIFSADFDWSKYSGFGPDYYLINQGSGMFVYTSESNRIRIGGYLPGVLYKRNSGVKTGSRQIVWRKGKWLRAYNLASGERTLRRLPKKRVQWAVIRNGAVIAVPTRRVEDKQHFRLRIVRF